MRIEILGAAQEVTGACFLLHVGRRRILIDCGLIQGNYADELRNRDPFPFQPDRLDAVILSHAHLDHSGRLPLLIKNGYKGKILTHHATRDLARILLRDAAYLSQKESEWTSKKRARKGLAPVEPLYSTADANATIKHIRAIGYEEIHPVCDGVEVILHDAGHILGSAIVEVRCIEEGTRRTIVYSGDLGHSGAPILRDPTRLAQADLLLLEATYGDRLHRDWSATWLELGDILQKARDGGGNILIPAFAVGRTQEILYQFKRHFTEWGLDHWYIFLDSPLAIDATQIYARHAALYDAEAKRMHHDGDPFSLPNLRFSKSAAQSMAINRIHSGAIIIAGSGMCDGGRIKHHLKHHLWRGNSHVIFTGFQARGTLGRRIVDGSPFIRLWGETIKVSAHIHTIGGLSAHADQAGIVNWVQAMKNRPQIALVHGEAKGLEGLQAALTRTLSHTAQIPVRGQILEV